MQNQIYIGDWHQEIIALFNTTFTHSEGEQEGKLIGNLVQHLIEKTDAEELLVFTSVEHDAIIGAVCFSKMKFEESASNVWLLSPAAVHPKFQGRGVGQSLINYAHSLLKEEGVDIVITYGDINFYSKVGYKPITEAVIKAPLTLSYPEGWIAQSLQGGEIEPILGKPSCVEAFNNPVYW